MVYVAIDDDTCGWIEAICGHFLDMAAGNRHLSPSLDNFVVCELTRYIVQIASVCGSYIDVISMLFYWPSMLMGALSFRLCDPKRPSYIYICIYLYGSIFLYTFSFSGQVFMRVFVCVYQSLAKVSVKEW